MCWRLLNVITILSFSQYLLWRFLSLCSPSCFNSLDPTSWQLSMKTCSHRCCKQIQLNTTPPKGRQTTSPLASATMQIITLHRISLPGTSVNFPEKRSSFTCHVQYWEREREDLKIRPPSSFLSITEIMNSTKAHSLQEMMSRRLIQLSCKSRWEGKNAKLPVGMTGRALFTALKHVHRGIVLFSEVTKEKGEGKKQKRNHIKKIQKGKKASP